MADEMIVQTLGRISGASNGPPWTVDSNHRTLLEAIGRVPEGPAKTVLIDLLAVVGVLNRRVHNIYLSTEPFLNDMDPDFREMLEEQERALGDSDDPMERLAAILSLAGALGGKVHEHAAARRAPKTSLLDDVRKVVAEIQNS